MKQKRIKFGKVKIKLLELPKSLTIQLNFGRYKKGKKIDTWTIYNAILEKHKSPGDEVWLDIQNKRSIGMSIMLNKTI